MANIDDRGHEKAELVMFDPQAPNFQVLSNKAPDSKVQPGKGQPSTIRYNQVQDTKYNQV